MIDQMIIKNKEYEEVLKHFDFQKEAYLLKTHEKPMANNHFEAIKKELEEMFKLYNLNYHFKTVLPDKEVTENLFQKMYGTYFFKGEQNGQK